MNKVLFIVISIASVGAFVTASPSPTSKGARDAFVLHDMMVPSYVSRSISDAWNYNRLQRTVLENQLAGYQAELARLKVDEQQLQTRLKSEFQVDTAGGDIWNERTLEIHRRSSP